MKPVLIQTLIKRNKNQRKVEPISEQELEHYRNKSASFVLWVLAIIVFTGLLLS